MRHFGPGSAGYKARFGKRAQPLRSDSDAADYAAQSSADDDAFAFVESDNADRAHPLRDFNETPDQSEYDDAASATHAGADEPAAPKKRGLFGRGNFESRMLFSGGAASGDTSTVSPFCWACLWFWLFLLFFVAALIMGAILRFGFYTIPKVLYGQEYLYWRTQICERILHNDCEPIDATPSTIYEPMRGTPVLSEGSVLSAWVDGVSSAQVLESKIYALDVTYSIVRDNTLVKLNTGNVLTGMYEHSLANRGHGQRHIVEAGVHYLLAGANGDYDARELFYELELPQGQESDARRAFEGLHILNGAEGYLRLGQIYLGDYALDYLNPLYPETRPRFFGHLGVYSNDFLVNRPEYGKAYEAMHKAVLCNKTDALQWRNYISTLAAFSEADKAEHQQRAERELRDIASKTIGGIADHCEANTLRQRINQLADPAVIYRFIVDRRAWPTVQDFVEKLQLPEPEFDRWIGVLIRESYEVYGFEADYLTAPYGGAGRPQIRDGDRAPGSQYYRQSPGGDVTDRPSSPEEIDRADYLACADNAAAELAAGDAYLRIGNTREAQRYYQQALTTGRVCAAPAVDKAQKRLAAMNLACEYNAESLARISRDADPAKDPDEEGAGMIIDIRARQQALRAHGYYMGNVDGRYGSGTRAAVSKFQSDYGFDETGDLTPIETVYLLCSAATVKDDVPSMNTLGMMYLVGLGVVQNTDAGMRYMKAAADRGYPDAMYNLALVYGLGVVHSSYKLCSVPEDLARADSYLEDAARFGHPRALRLVRDYGSLGPTARWAAYEEWLRANNFIKKTLTEAPDACRPNPPKDAGGGDARQ